jgi:hypothetical protein
MLTLAGGRADAAGCAGRGSRGGERYNTIIGSSQAPYINKLAAACGLATNYHNISRPSLPNYVGLTSRLHRSSGPTGSWADAKSPAPPGASCRADGNGLGVVVALD